MTSQQAFFKNDSEELQRLQLFSKFSEQDNKKRPRIRKISQNKPPRGNVQYKNIVSLNKKPGQNRQSLAYMTSPRDQYFQTDKATKNSNLMHQLYAKQIKILKEQIQRMKEDKYIIENNHRNQVQYYLREQYSIILTLSQLIKTKQYQRIQQYMKNQLEFLTRRYEQQFHEVQFTLKPVLTRDVTAQSFIQQDPSFKKLLSNLSDNIKSTGITRIDILPQIRKLNSEKELSVKKLSWYLSQLPFQISEKSDRNCLAKQIIADLGYDSGDQVVSLIQKNVDKISPTLQSKKSQQATGFRSQISEIIEGHMVF